MQDRLKKYKSMRSKSKTPEPFSSNQTNEQKLVFVVQKHQATALHYDFRLESNGVMPSWAIPKGPSLDPSVKRLAIKTEDHPLDYRNFEGVIPENQYGAGPVMIWDEGYYYPEIENSKKDREEIKDKKQGENIIDEGIKKGEIKFKLFGKKLSGSFALIKTKNFIPNSTKENWLLIKHKDEHIKPGFDAKDFDFSARTKKSIKEIQGN